MPSRLAVLNVTDLVGYTRLMGEDEAQAIGAIRELKDQHLEPRILETGGEVLKRMGDGWIFAFNSVTAALQGSMQVQETLYAHPVIKLRMGLHIGEIVEDEMDFYGAGVNLAARLQAEAPPGGLMISQDLHRQLTGDLSKAFSDSGSFNFKNIDEPVSCFQWRPLPGRLANPGEVPSIAVEAFAYAPENADGEATTADLREQLVYRLSKRTGVKVRDVNSDAAKDTIYLLRGRLRMSGSRCRVHLSLIVRDSGNTAWTQVYDGDTSDILAFCDDVIEKATADLRIQINSTDDERLKHLPDDQLSVSELRSRAASRFYKATMESWQDALKLTERAVDLNPDDPMALAMRALAKTLLATARFRDLDKKQADQIANDLDRSVELSPRSDFVFATRSLFRCQVAGDFQGAIMDADRAISINPTYHIAYDGRATAYLLKGDTTRSISDFEKSVSLSGSDPLLPYRLFLLSIAYHLAGRPQDAIDTVEKAIQLRPSLRAYHVLKAQICSAMNDAMGAKGAEERASQLPAEPSILAPRPPVPEGHTELVGLLSPRSRSTA